MRVHPALLVLLALIAAPILSGCGNKGPLVTPDHKPPAKQSPGAPATPPGETVSAFGALPISGGSPANAGGLATREPTRHGAV
ncbi:MAG: lipoprotein [Rhodanobacteraceae bacterium]